jgi:hypothetical protein
MTRSSPTSAPVCDSALLAASALLPAFSTTTALPKRAARSAWARKAAGSRMPSTNMPITEVASSSTR